MSAFVNRIAKAAILPLVAAVVALIAGWDWRVAVLTIVLAIPVGWMLSKPTNR